MQAIEIDECSSTIERRIVVALMSFFASITE